MNARHLLVALLVAVAALGAIAIAQLELALQATRGRAAFAEHFVDSRVGPRSLTLNREQRNGDASFVGERVPGIGDVHVFARKVGIDNKYACVVNTRDAATELAWEYEVAPCFAVIGNKIKDARLQSQRKLSKSLKLSAAKGKETADVPEVTIIAPGATAPSAAATSSAEQAVAALDREFAQAEVERARSGNALPFFNIKVPPLVGGWVLTLMILAMVVTASSRVTALLESRDSFADEPWLILDARSVSERVVAWAEHIAVAAAAVVAVGLQLAIVLSTKSLRGTESWPLFQLSALAVVLALQIPPSKNLFVGLNALKKRRRPSQRPSAQPEPRPATVSTPGQQRAKTQAASTQQGSVKHSSIQQRGAYAAPQQPQQPYASRQAQPSPEAAPPQQGYQHPAGRRR